MRGATARLGCGRMVAMVAQALALILLARSVSPASFGLFSAVLGAMLALQAVAEGGATYALLKHHAASDDRATAEIFRLGRALGAIASVIGLAGLAVAYMISGAAVVVLMAPLALWVAFERRTEIHSAYLIANGNVTAVAVGVAARRIVVLCAVALSSVGDASILSYATASAVAAAANSVLLSIYFPVPSRASVERKIGSTAGRKTSRQTISLLLPYWSTNLAQSVRQLDVMVVALFGGVYVASNYAPASRIITPLMLLPTTYSQLLLSHLARTKRRPRTWDIVLPAIVTLLLLLPVAASAPFWITRLLGPAYSGAVAPMQVVLLGLVFAVVSSPLGSIHQASGRQKLAAGAAWIGTVTSFALAVVLCGVAGAVGAAIGVLSGHALQALVLVMALRLAASKDRTDGLESASSTSSRSINE